jgi:hypothetical protein
VKHVRARQKEGHGTARHMRTRWLFARFFAIQGYKYPKMMDVNKTESDCFHFVAFCNKIHPKNAAGFHVKIPCLFLVSPAASI